jgi:P-type Ca2+ transporter type 2C
MDPPRMDVTQAMQSFHTAGIRVVMVTGDYGLTAASIATRIGMLSTPNPRILTGLELDEMEDAELEEALEEETIFARMAPEHKLRLVAAFQARGEVVAVIGDGVNDAPALRKADVGIAMGITGTDVARDAADVILSGDNFYSAVEAIREGRGVYANLRKFITYIFASNVPEIVPFLLTALFNLPLALSVAQILAIDLGTDLFPALALGSERPEPDILAQPPRRRNQTLIDAALLRRAYLWLGSIEAGLCFLGFSLVYYPWPSLPDFFHLGLGGLEHSPQLASTVFFSGVILAQIGNALACRSETNTVRKLGIFSNPGLLFAIGLELILGAGLIYVPLLARTFGNVPLPPVYGLGLVSFAPILYGLERTRKWFWIHINSIRAVFLRRATLRGGVR